MAMAFFYLAEIGYFRLAQNGRFRPALTKFVLNQVNTLLIFKSHHLPIFGYLE